MCCTNHNDPKWVEVTLEDSAFLPKAMYAKGDVETYAMVQDQAGTCCALIGEIGNRCKCGIYEDRPSICREVERGSSVCLTSIARYQGRKE
jgi:Fe-S-cluster containining protein